MSCGYCRGLRMSCICAEDCGERGMHLCRHAPTDEARAWFKNWGGLYSDEEIERIMAKREAQT